MKKRVVLNQQEIEALAYVMKEIFFNNEEPPRNVNGINYFHPTLVLFDRELETLKKFQQKIIS